MGNWATFAHFSHFCFEVAQRAQTRWRNPQERPGVIQETQIDKKCSVALREGAHVSTILKTVFIMLWSAVPVVEVQHPDERGLVRAPDAEHALGAEEDAPGA